MIPNPGGCQCRYCKRADRHHDLESEQADLTRQAVTRHDHAEASYHDRMRVHHLEAASRSLMLCEGKETE